MCGAIEVQNAAAARCSLSECEFHGSLRDTRIGSAGDHSERAGINIRAGIVEVGVVKQIEHFKTHFKIKALRNHKPAAAFQFIAPGRRKNRREALPSCPSASFENREVLK
jgi:hypothetical protein